MSFETKQDTSAVDADNYFDDLEHSLVHPTPSECTTVNSLKRDSSVSFSPHMKSVVRDCMQQSYKNGFEAGVNQAPLECASTVGDDTSTDIDSESIMSSDSVEDLYNLFVCPLENLHNTLGTAVALRTNLDVPLLDDPNLKVILHLCGSLGHVNISIKTGQDDEFVDDSNVVEMNDRTSKRILNCFR